MAETESKVECAVNIKNLKKSFDGGKDFVLNGLAMFDEHNSKESYMHIHNAIDYAGEQRSHHQIPVFRVVDETTRDASLQPVKAGLVIFNLKERRIIQVQKGANVVPVPVSDPNPVSK